MLDHSLYVVKNNFTASFDLLQLLYSKFFPNLDILNETSYLLFGAFYFSAREKFDIGETENLTFTDLEGTIVEADCILDVLNLPNATLTIQIEEDNDSLPFSSSTSTLSVSENTPSANEVMNWLQENNGINDANKISEIDDFSLDATNRIPENKIESCTGNIVSVINIDKDGFVIPGPSAYNIDGKTDGDDGVKVYSYSP